MLRFSLLLVAVFAVGGVVFSAAMVLDTPEPSPKDEALMGEPDPEAPGVLVVSVGTAYQSLSPDGTLLGARPAPLPAGLSADGAWTAYEDCNDSSCDLMVTSVDGNVVLPDLALEGRVLTSYWSESGAMLAILDDTGNLYWLEPSAADLRKVASGVATFAWVIEGRLVYSLMAGNGSELHLWQDGTDRRFADLASPVERFYVSPDGRLVAFTQDSVDGWRLMALDVESAEVTNFGNLGRISEANAMTVAPELAIAWSPDQSLIAVGPVSAPYALHVFDDSGAPVLRHVFEEGYAGELKWSPDGDQLAISTYSPDRSRHEVYVVAPDNGVVRHLMPGCLIQWAPDGRFLAAKLEPHTEGIGAVRVESGHSWQVIGGEGQVPLSWGADEASALELAISPLRSSVRLAK